MNENIKQMKYDEGISFIKRRVCAHLTDYPKMEFKIRKTSDLDECKQGYAGMYLWPLATGAPEVINQAEKDIVAFFKNNPMCKNEHEGGGGSTDATLLYLAMRMKENSTIDDLCDDMVDITDLPINLTNIKQ